MRTIKIRNKHSLSVLFEVKATSIKEALKEAVKAKADLRWANLAEADLTGAVLPTYQTCPPSGDFPAWKKGANGCIIKLKIPWYVRRCSTLIGRKCRAETAIVLSIKDKKGDEVESCTGWSHSYAAQYTVGRFVFLHYL